MREHLPQVTKEVSLIVKSLRPSIDVSIQLKKEGQHLLLHQHQQEGDVIAVGNIK